MTHSPSFSMCVYCGSRPGKTDAFGEAAQAVGHWIGSHGGQLVYGGGKSGLMGTVARATREAGGRVVGVIPKALVDRELANELCDELHVVTTMHERKAMMADRSDGFIALSGGIGTFEELFEIWTWGQLGYHAKPVGLLNVAGFYDKLVGFVDDVVAAGFLRQAHRDMLLSGDDPAALVAGMRAYTPTAMEKWIGREQR